MVPIVCEFWMGISLPLTDLVVFSRRALAPNVLGYNSEHRASRKTPTRGRVGSCACAILTPRTLQFRRTPARHFVGFSRPGHDTAKRGQNEKTKTAS